MLYKERKLANKKQGKRTKILKFKSLTLSEGRQEQTMFPRFFSRLLSRDNHLALRRGPGGGSSKCANFYCEVLGKPFKMISGTPEKASRWSLNNTKSTTREHAYVPKFAAFFLSFHPHKAHFQRICTGLTREHCEQT